jgi:hypothetical protein
VKGIVIIFFSKVSFFPNWLSSNENDMRMTIGKNFSMELGPMLP